MSKWRCAEKVLTAASQLDKHSYLQLMDLSV